MVIEAIWKPNDNDSGFFAYFESIFRRLPLYQALGDVEFRYDRPKSIVVKGDQEVWVCFSLKIKEGLYANQITETIFKIDFQTGLIKPDESTPPADLVRHALPELWNILGKFLSLPVDSYMTANMARLISERTLYTFLYEEETCDIRSYSLGRSATIAEIVQWLSDPI